MFLVRRNVVNGNIVIECIRCGYRIDLPKNNNRIYEYDSP